MNRGRARAALVLGAIVVGSGLAGAGIDHWALSRHGRHGRGGGISGTLTPEQQAKRRGDMLDRMNKDLDLSTAQRAGIDSVLQRTDSALRVVRGEMQPRLKAILDSSRAEISSRLDDQQRARFAKMQPPRRPRP